MAFNGPNILSLLINREHIRVRRADWPAGNFVALQPVLELPPYSQQDTQRKVNDRTAALIGPDAPLHVPAHLVHWNAEKQIYSLGWTFPTYDLLANDWEVLEADAELVPPPLSFSVNIQNVSADLDIRTREVTTAGEVQVVTNFFWRTTTQVDHLENGLDRSDALLKSRFLADVSPFIDILVRDGLAAASMLTPVPNNKG